MSEYQTRPQLPLAGEQSWPEARAQDTQRDVVRVALVHVLTPEFHNLDSAEFADIPERVVANASAAELQGSLFWPYVRKGERTTEEVSTFSYRTPDEGFMTVALTPEEYDTASESVDKLAQRIFNKVLTQRDAALRKQTGDESARARGEEDLRAARRGAMRAVMDQQAGMERLLREGILPKVEVINKFVEMTEGRNPNLVRGTEETVGARLKELKESVFDDMLDVVGLQRGWTETMTARAKQIIQKRLYISGTVRERVANFHEMLALAQAYYGYKRALLLTKIEDTRRYMRENPDVVADIIAVDEQRRLEKEVKQLQLEADG